jgi:hypothetical protein
MVSLDQPCRPVMPLKLNTNRPLGRVRYRIRNWPQHDPGRQALFGPDRMRLNSRRPRSRANLCAPPPGWRRPRYSVGRHSPRRSAGPRTPQTKAKRQGRPRGSKLDPHESFLLALVEETDDITLIEMQDHLRAERGVPVGLARCGASSRAARSPGKKSAHKASWLRGAIDTPLSLGRDVSRGILDEAS